MGIWSWLFGSGDKDTVPDTSAAPADTSGSGNDASFGSGAQGSGSSGDLSFGSSFGEPAVFGYGRALSRDGLDRAMRELGVGPAELWTLINVETRGYGFLQSRLPIILFERHVFSRETGGRFDATAPDISNPRRGGYQGFDAEYARLERAAALDYDAALRSASWGLGQIMGFNAENLGYEDVRAMVTLMRQSEDDQLNGIVAFLLTEGIDDFLRNHDWADLALRYNGVAYRENNYDARLAAEYQKFANGGAVPNVYVRTAQLYLDYLGFSPYGIDGLFGSKTRSAVADYLTSKGQPTDPDDVTPEITIELVPQLTGDVTLLPDVWPLPPAPL